MDINSGAIHIISDIVYDILDFYPTEPKQAVISKLADTYSIQELKEAFDEIETLKQDGMLFADDSQVTTAMLEGRGQVIKAMCLHVAHDCNMRCKYCFGDTGAFEGRRSMLSFETGKQAIDFLLTHSGTRRNLEIDFFGGEPLMNFEVVKQLVAYGHEAEKALGRTFASPLPPTACSWMKKRAALLMKTWKMSS